MVPSERCTCYLKTQAGWKESEPEAQEIPAINIIVDGEDQLSHALSPGLASSDSLTITVLLRRQQHTIK